MKKQSRVVVINDNLAEAINLFEYRKFNKRNNINFLDCSFKVPGIVLSNFDDVLDIIKGNDFTAATFNNVAENEKRFCSAFVKDKNTLFENRMVTEISNSYNYDLERKINTFIYNSFDKMVKLFEEQYSMVLYSENNLEQIDMISLKYGIRVQDLNWLFKKIKELNEQKIVFSIKDLSDSTNTNLRMFISDEEILDVFQLISKLLNVDLFDVLNCYEYFGKIFNKLQLDVAKATNESKLTKDFIRAYLSYYKMLAMRVFEFFDIFKNTTIDTVNIEKMSFLISNIEKEILYLESLL